MAPRAGLKLSDPRERLVAIGMASRGRGLTIAFVAKQRPARDPHGRCWHAN